MARLYNIKWRQQDYNRLRQEIRRFNSKRTRLIRSNPQLEEYLPSRLNFNTLKNQIKTRQDFNREINSIARFQNRNASRLITSSTGNTITQYEKQEVAYKVAAINRRRTAQRKMVESGPQQSFTMGTIESNNLNPKKFNFNRIRPGKEWEKYVQSVNKQIQSRYFIQQAERYKENYLNSITENLGQAGQKLYELVSSLDPVFMYSRYYSDPVLQIQFTSDPIPSDVIADAAYERWEQELEDEE